MFLMGWLVMVLPHGCCCSDVKPENILALVEDGTRLIKVLLADFGEAKHLTQSITHVSAAGTPVYMAPEMMVRLLQTTPNFLVLIDPTLHTVYCRRMTRRKLRKLTFSLPVWWPRSSTRARAPSQGLP